MLSPMLPDTAAHYDRIVGSMTAEQKLASTEALWHTAWELKVAGVRMQHPEWSEEQVAAQVRRIFLRATT